MAHAELEELAALALDPQDVDAEIRAHVASCPECRSAVASLIDVRRTAGDGPLVPPPTGLRDRVLAEAFGDGAAPAGSPGSTVALKPSRRRVPLWAAGVAAAAALVVGVAVGQVVGGRDGEPGRQPTVIAETDLTTVQGTAPRGLARVVESDGSVTLHVEASALGGRSGLREVWLLNVDGTRMVSLGFLPPAETGDFDVPQRLLEQGYRIVDISIEPDDGNPAHSGVSVARGELA